MPGRPVSSPSTVNSTYKGSHGACTSWTAEGGGRWRITIRSTPPMQASSVGPGQGGAEDVIPGVDQSGFNYYSYARDGFSLRTGEKIRVVTLAPSITETVAAIGGLDYVVGTDLYSNYPEEVIKRQEKGDISIVGDTPIPTTNGS